MSRARFLVAAATIALCAATEPATSPPAIGQSTASFEYWQKVVCEKQEVVGSRLATRRVCKTRAEWAEEKLQARQDLEKLQVQRGIPGNQ